MLVMLAATSSKPASPNRATEERQRRRVRNSDPAGSVGTRVSSYPLPEGITWRPYFLSAASNCRKLELTSAQHRNRSGRSCTTRTSRVALVINMRILYDVLEETARYQAEGTSA